MVHRSQAAEDDILREVFLALWENRHKLEPVRVSGWLFVVSYNNATYLKKLKEPDVVRVQAVYCRSHCHCRSG